MRTEESQRKNTPLTRARPVRSPANVAHMTHEDRERADEENDDDVQVRPEQIRSELIRKRRFSPWHWSCDQTWRTCSGHSARTCHPLSSLQVEDVLRF